MSTVSVIGAGMGLVRTIVTHIPASTDPPKDYAVNVVYHNIAGGIIWGDPDYQNHATEVAQLFHGDKTGNGSTFKYYSHTQVMTKVYSMDDAEPRPIRGQATVGAASISPANHLPRVLAICLSFYATQNIPSQRGRLFIGPFNLTDEPSVGPVVGGSDQAKVVDLGHGLYDLGGINVNHVVYSPTKSNHYGVTDYWCNDVWDVMHSRESKEASRTRLHP